MVKKLFGKAFAGKTLKKVFAAAVCILAGAAVFFGFQIAAEAQTQQCEHFAMVWAVVKEPTCSSVGYYGWKCYYCGEAVTYEEEIAKTSHTWDVKYTTKATTKKQGVAEYTCTECGKTKTKSYGKVAEMTLAKTSYVYNGNKKTPSITVFDENGNKISSKYYKVTYISRSSGKQVSSIKSVGKYYVKITFKTKYSGTLKKSVTVKPKSPSVKSVTGVSAGFKVSWGKITSCTTGYQIQYSTDKSFSDKTTKTVSDNTVTSKKITSLKAAKKYYVRVRTYKKVKVDGKSTTIYSAWSSKTSVVTLPKATSISSAAYSSKGKITVKWKKSSAADGYVIQYSTAKGFGEYKTCTVFVNSSSKTSKTIGGLAGTTYYVRVGTYKKVSGKKYVSDWSSAKSVTVKQGLSLKEMINYIKTDLSGRDAIKSYTDGGVDISKYSSTYDRVKAIYDWHAKHNTDYGWNCLGCNSNFNYCLYALFSGTKTYDTFITIEAGNYKNSDGSVVMHKWSVIYIAGVKYIFDPRLQGYNSSYSSTRYFGVTPSSEIGKKYLSDGLYIIWESPNTITNHVAKSR